MTTQNHSKSLGPSVLKLTNEEFLVIFGNYPFPEVSEELQKIVNQLFLFSDELPFSDPQFNDARITILHAIDVFNRLEEKMSDSAAFYQRYLK